MNVTEPRKLSPLLVILLLCCALCVVYALGALLLKLAHSFSAAPQASKLPPGMVFHGSPIAWRALPGYAGALSSLSPPRLLAGRFHSTSEDSLLLLGLDGSVRIMALDGAQAASWQSHADEQSLCCAWDWDGDGLDEVLINELKPGGGERVVAYKTDGTLLADEPDLALSFRCAPADLDGDGHSEMFFAAGKEGFLARNAQGEVVWRLSEVDLDGLIKAGRFRLPLNGEPRLLGAADSNADGKFELLIQGGHNGSFLLAGLDGAPLSFDPPALDPNHIADLDSDRRSELIDPERGVYDTAQQRLRYWQMPGWSTEELIDGLHSSAGDFGPQLGRCALVLSSPGFESRLRAFDAKGELLYDEKLETSCHGLTRFEGPQGPGVALLTGTSLLVCP